jgi:hypothetical protein
LQQYPKLEHAIAAVSIARTCRFDRVTNGEKGERKPTQKFTTADFEEACQSRKRKHIGDKESPEPTRATAESELSPAGASTRTTRSANAIIRKSDSDSCWLEAQLIGIQSPASDNGDPHEEFGSDDSCRAHTTAPVHDGNETDNWIPKALDFVSKKGSSIPSIENHTLITLPITYRELEEESKKDSPKMTSEWTQVIPKLRLHKTSVIIQTSDHKVVCYKINSHYKDCANLNKLCVGLEKSWTATGKDLPQETKVTTRYLQTELVDRKVSGTFHFALWMERAHVKEGPLISAETLGANCSRRHSMVQGFLCGLESLQERASTILKETYPAIHQQYSTFYQGIQDLVTGGLAA